MRKILLFLLVLLVSMVGVNAALIDNSTLYYTMDNADLIGGQYRDTTGNGWNTTINTGTTGVSGILNEADQFDGINDEIEFSSSLTLSNEWAINLWANITGANPTQVLLAKNQAGNQNDISIETRSSGFFFQVDNGATLYSLTNTTFDPRDSNWHMWTVTYDGSNLRGYLDGVLKGTVACSGCDIISTGKAWELATDRNSAWLTGSLDEVGMWARNFTLADVTEIYNAGAPSISQQYPFASGASSVTTNLQALYNVSNISIEINATQEINLSYSLDGAANISVWTNQNNGTLNLTGLVEGAHNITWIGATTNLTENFTVDLTKPVIGSLGISSSTSKTVNFSNVYNITDALSGLLSCSLNITYSENITGSYDRFGDCDDTYSFEAAGLYNVYLLSEDNAGNINASNFNFTIEPQLSVNFFDADTNAIENYSVDIYHPDGFIESITNINNPVNLSPYHNNSLDLGNYTIEFNKSGFQLFNVTVAINETSGGEEYNFTILNASIVINLYSDDTKTLITNKSFSLQLSGIAGYIFNSSGELFNITTQVLAGEYTGLISSDDFESKEIFFSYTAQEAKELDVYFIPLNLTNLGFVTIEAFKADNTPNRYISAYAKQWFAGDSAYKKVQETKTGGDGTAELKIILEDYIYQFCIYTEENGETCTGDEIVKTTENGQVIPITEENRIQTVDSYSELLDFSENISVVVSNVSGFRNLYVQFDWVDLSGFDLDMCYTIHKDFDYIEEEVESACVSGAAGEFEQIYLLNSSYAYTVTVKAVVDGVSLPMYYDRFVSEDASANIENVLIDKGMSGLALVLYIVVVMTIVALLKNPFHGVIVVFVAVLGINTFFSTLMSPFALSSLMVFCGMTAWGLRQLR